MTRKGPPYWENKAMEFESDKEWEMAARCWVRASAASLGHSRSERYNRAANNCALKKLKQERPSTNWAWGCSEHRTISEEVGVHWVNQPAQRF